MSPSSCQEAREMAQGGSADLLGPLGFERGSKFNLLPDLSKEIRQEVMTLHCSGFWPPDLFLLYSSNYILIHCPSISFLRTPRWVSREKISWDILITTSFLLENMVSVPILCLGDKCYHLSSSLHLPSGISLWHLHHYIRPTENRHRETLKDTGTPLLPYSLMP